MAQVQNLVKGVDRTLSTLNDLKVSASKSAHRRLMVGYSAFYAGRVHEDLQMVHANGQAKFLEVVLRTKRNDIAQIVRGAFRMGKTMTQALMLAAGFIKRESQALVPVRTGFLRDSWFEQVY